MVVVASGCGSAGCTAGRTSSTAASGIDCAKGRTIRDEGAYALAISANGQVCWEAALATPTGNSSFPSTPIIDGGTAVFDSAGDVYAVDLGDGHQRWRWSSGDAPAISGFGGGNNVLAVADGRVLATRGAPGHEQVVGLDESSGSVVWTQAIPFSHSGPTMGPGGTLLIDADSGAVNRAISDRTGRTLWSHPQPSPAPSGGGLVEVYAPATLAGSDLVEHGADNTQAVDAASGATLWTRPGRTNDAQYTDGTLLLTPPPGEGAGHYDVPTTAVDPVTGRTLWSTTPLDPGGSQFSSAGGDLVHSEIGESSAGLERLDPANGAVLWRAAINAYEVVGADGDLVDLESTAYQAGTPSIVGRDPATGAIRWRTTLPVAGISRDVVDDRFFSVGRGPGAVVIDEHDDELTGIDAGTGAVRWHLSIPGQGEDTIVSAGGGLVVDVLDGAYVMAGH